VSQSILNLDQLLPNVDDVLGRAAHQRLDLAGALLDDDAGLNVNAGVEVVHMSACPHSI
jgi:hypothetical protein